MERILLIGNAGAGKTTFARQLAAKLSLPLVHLDQLYWCGSWEHLSRDAFDRALQAELDAAAVAGVDVTMPGATLPAGGLHPISIVRDEAVRVLRRMGFTLSDGPEIEDEWHCFDALNTPDDHPARNEKDTFSMVRACTVLV